MLYYIECRRWFHKKYGNTYHSVTIYNNNKQIAYLPMQYGYGDQCLQSALNWLQENGHLPRRACNPTIEFRENGISYSIIDVQRRKDL